MRLLPLAFLVGCATAPAKQSPAPPAPARVAATPEPESPAMSEDEAQRFADLLSSDSDGPRDGDMSSRRQGADLRQQIDDVKSSGGTVAIGGGGTDARIDGATPSPRPPGPPGRITLASAIARDKTTLTRDAIVAKIQSVYMAGVKRCYQTLLRKDATARGRVVLKLPVNMSGRLVGPSAKGFHAEVDSCITGLMGKWTFPPAKDAAGAVTEATFDVTFQLVPD